MRVVLVAVGSRGDVVPFVALAERLVAEGHDPVLVSHAAVLPAHLEGVELVGVGSDPGMLLRGPAAQALRRGDLLGLNREREAFADYLTSVLEPAGEAMNGADVLVASTFAAAVVPTARSKGVPVVRAHLWPEFESLEGPMPVLPFSWLLPDRVRRRARGVLRRVEPLLAGFDGWWSGGRLQVVAHHRAGFTTTDLGSLHAYSPAIVGMGAGNGSPSREPHVGLPVMWPPMAMSTGWWTRPGRGRLTSRTCDLLADPGPPWVLVTFGSMPQGSPARLVRVVEQACRAGDLRALIQLDVGGEPMLTTDSRVHVIGPEPHEALMPRVAAVVHHGGSGTTAAVVRAGVPSVVVPHVADQFYWADRLHAAGAAAPLLPRPMLTARRLEQRLEQAMSPDVVACAQALGTRVRAEDGTAAAVRYLEVALAGGMPRA